MRATGRLIGRYALCAATVAALIAVLRLLIPVNATTAALLMLLLVLGAATRWGLAEAIFTSIVSVLGFNFYFLPPVGNLTIADPENWIALFVFLATAVTVSQLSAQARKRAEEAIAGRNEISTLYELSRSMLMDEALIEGARDAVRASVAKTGQILRLSHVAFLDVAANQVYGSLENSGISEANLRRVAETGVAEEQGDGSVIPVRLGNQIVGSLALRGARISAHTRDSIASLLAINYERVRALDRAAAAEAARRNEEFKSSLLDGLAHDLKTPLTAIRTCVTRLIEIPPRSEEVRHELLSIIDDGSKRLQNSITEAIELARIESQSLSLHREPTTVRVVVEAAVAHTRDESPSRFAVTLPDGLTLNVDRDLIRRALLQLLENAHKYSPPDSPIEIEARSEGDHAMIAVRDRGPGIAADELDRVFEKFYRGRRTSNRIEGTGMGLAIAKAIVEAHGGKIHARNRAGGGTEVSFSLPRTDNGQTEAE